MTRRPDWRCCGQSLIRTNIERFTVTDSRLSLGQTISAKRQSYAGCQRNGARSRGGDSMSRKLLTMFCVGLLTCSLAAIPALSQGHGKGKGHDKHGDDDDDRGHGKKARHDFDDHDREVVTQYYVGHGSGLPPGLAKRGGNLPPGLE